MLFLVIPIKLFLHFHDDHSDLHGNDEDDLLQDNLRGHYEGWLHGRTGYRVCGYFDALRKYVEVCNGLGYLRLLQSYVHLPGHYSYCEDVRHADNLYDRCVEFSDVHNWRSGCESVHYECYCFVLLWS